MTADDMATTSPEKMLNDLADLYEQAYQFHRTLYDICDPCVASEMNYHGRQAVDALRHMRHCMLQAPLIEDQLRQNG